MSARHTEPEPGGTVAPVASNDPDWAFGPDATLSAVAALPARPRVEPAPAEPRPRPRRPHRLRTALLVIAAAGGAARLTYLELANQRQKGALKNQAAALEIASTTGTERDRRLADLEQQVRQTTASLAEARAKLARAETTASQAKSEADELRQAVAAKQGELDQSAKDLEEARQRALRTALEEAKSAGGDAQRPAHKAARGGHGSTH